MWRDISYGATLFGAISKFDAIKIDFVAQYSHFNN